MAALSANNSSTTFKPRGQKAMTVVSGDIVYAGGLVGTDPNGFLFPWDGAAAADKFAGIAKETVTGDGTLKCAVDTSGVVLEGVAVTGATQAGVNSLVYCSTDNPADFTLTATTAGAVGWLCHFVSASDCDVELFTPAEHLAL